MSNETLLWLILLLSIVDTVLLVVLLAGRRRV